MVQGKEKKRKIKKMTGIEKTKREKVRAERVRGRIEGLNPDI